MVGLALVMTRRQLALWDLWTEEKLSDKLNSGQKFSSLTDEFQHHRQRQGRAHLFSTAAFSPTAKEALQSASAHTHARANKQTHTHTQTNTRARKQTNKRARANKQTNTHTQTHSSALSAQL